MAADIINIALAFLEGIALIVSPCILPILPIVLSGSLTGNKKRPLGIIFGFMVTFALVTLFSRTILDAAHINPDAVRYVSYGLLLFFGFVMLSTSLAEKFTNLTQGLVNVGSSVRAVNDQESGFAGGILFGILIGVIWTPCAGPILAAAIVQVIIQKTTLQSVMVVMAFALGAGVPMLLIAMLGRNAIHQFNFLRQHTVLIRKLLGLVIIATVIMLIISPTWFYPKAADANVSMVDTPVTGIINGVPIPYHAPAIGGITAWINSPPLNLNDLTGKVVLIDFWTYSCINCIRTLPYLKAWYEKYHDKGLVIIGIHSPEFAFEKNLDNVKYAVNKFSIPYPVALDNDFVTWQNYQNEYWPAHYLIAKNGDVVEEHYGEGGYAETENNIRYLLGLTGPAVVQQGPAIPLQHQTPETYLGYERMSHVASVEPIARDKPAIYSYPASLTVDAWALKGTWLVYPDKVVAVSPGASIKLHYAARTVYAVMGVAYQAVKIQVLHNGKAVASSPIDIDTNQLYTLLDGKAYSEGEIEIIAEKPGLEVYTFTFGA